MGKSSGSLLSNILKIVFIFLIALALLAFAAYFALRVFVRGAEVEVPNVIGKTYIDACKMLDEHGLNTVKIEGEQYSTKLPPGYVIKQDPIPKQKVKQERIIKVFLSKGTEQGRVPRLIGYPISDIEPKLASAGLEMGTVVKVHSDNFPQEGIVIAHTPPPDAEVQWGSKIDILVSLGAYSVRLMMPELKDMDFQEAIKLLERSGLEQGNITYEDSQDGKKANIVLGQFPQAGERIEKGDAVDIVVSKASEDRGRTARLSYTVPKKPMLPSDDPEMIVGPMQEDRDERLVKIELDHEGIQRPVEIINKLLLPGKPLSYFLRVKGVAIAKIYVDNILTQTMVCKPLSTEFVIQ